MQPPIMEAAVMVPAISNRSQAEQVYVPPYVLMHPYVQQPALRPRPMLPIHFHLGNQQGHSNANPCEDKDKGKGSLLIPRPKVMSLGHSYPNVNGCGEKGHTKRNLGLAHGISPERC